jgi:predicted NUDIX family NTP pyrophosphohydrolase
MRGKGVEVLLGHPGGPYYARRFDGVWSIPKGRAERGEDLEAAARREFEEETGTPPEGELKPLGFVVQAAGKRVFAWAMRWPEQRRVQFQSNTYELEWPPGSGRIQEFEEFDRIEFLTMEQARKALVPAQTAFLERLEATLRDEPS